MKFETIKANAAAQFSRMVDEEAAVPGAADRLGGPVGLSFQALASDLGLTEALRHKTLAQVKAAGLSRIAAWDVREVGKLLELFPAAAPALAGKQLQANMADTSDMDWIVELAPRPREQLRGW